MRRLAIVNEYNLVGTAVTLILGIILLVLFPISNRRLGDIFSRLTSILSHSSRVAALRKKLLLPTGFRGVNTETAQQAEEYISGASLKLASGNLCSLFSQYLNKYNPLLYMPLASTYEKKFNVLNPTILFKWVTVLLGAFTGWFCVSVLIYVYQTLYTGDTLEDQFLLSVALAILGAAAAQPIIFLVIWGFYAVYLRHLKKLFKVSEAKVKSEPAVNLNRSRLGFSQNQSVILDVQHSLNSTTRKGFLVEPARSDTGRIPLEPAGDAQSPNRASSPANNSDDFTAAIGDDAQMYAEEGKKNDGGFLEKFTVVCCVLIISMGLFAGFACFALSSTYAEVLFIGFCLETAVDILIYRLVICIILSIFASCSRCCCKKEPADPAMANFITKRELTTQNQQFTEISKLMQSPGGKVLTQTSPFIIQDDSNIAGHSSINLDKSQQDIDKTEEDEKKWAEFNMTASTFEDFNRILLRKIYMTYDPVTSDTLIKKWRSTNTTEELKEKNPELDVWNEAQEMAEYEGSQKKEFTEKNRLFSARGDSGKFQEETRVNDKILEDSKENQFEEERKSIDMSFTEPPNVAGGVELIERNEKVQTGVLKNIGIKGQMNPKMRSEKKVEAELMMDNIDELAITPELDIKSPRVFSLEMIDSQPREISATLPLKGAVKAYAPRNATDKIYPFASQSSLEATAKFNHMPSESEANIPTYKEEDGLDGDRILVQELAHKSMNMKEAHEEAKVGHHVNKEVAKEKVVGEALPAIDHSERAAKTSAKPKGKQKTSKGSPVKGKSAAAAKAFASGGSSAEKSPQKGKDSPVKATSQYATNKSGKSVTHKESKKVKKEKKAGAEKIAKNEADQTALEAKGESKDKAVKVESKVAEGNAQTTSKEVMAVGAKNEEQKADKELKAEEHNKNRIYNEANKEKEQKLEEYNENEFIPEENKGKEHKIANVGRDELSTKANKGKELKSEGINKDKPNISKTSEFSPVKAKFEQVKAKTNLSPDLKDVEVMQPEPDSCFAPHTEDAPKVIAAFGEDKVVKASNSPDKSSKSIHKSAKMAPNTNKPLLTSKPEIKEQESIDIAPETEGFAILLEDYKVNTKEKGTNAESNSNNNKTGKTEDKDFAAEEVKGEKAVKEIPAKRSSHKEVVSSQIQTDLRNTPTLNKKQPAVLTAASGVSAIEIESPAKKNEPANLPAAGTWSEKKKLLREQVFDLADILDKKISHISHKQSKRKLKSQLVKKYENSAKKDPIPLIGDNKESENEGDKHSDSDVIDDGTVQFKGNFVHSDGENHLAAEDVIYYPKEDLTNYSKNKGLNKMNARPINRAEEFQSDTDIFAHIEKSLLQPYNSSPRAYESDQDYESRLGEIVEDVGSENDPIENPKKVLRNTKRNAPLSKKMTQTARQFQRPLIKKSVSQDLSRRKKQIRKKPMPEFSVPVIKRQQQFAPQKSFESPYSELLYKRYKEYQPDEAVSIFRVKHVGQAWNRREYASQRQVE
eukprot:TRINITY_DN105041_c2_g1_i1.p1 TRINITY_DN105041_c2_g1~~TRINITY_DN105041_c2_g1_i1.p1  ORF type:complete len:1559 (-),score=216.46 TRINITY_DN105041_c2_g1_i1:433-4893(-)